MYKIKHLLAAGLLSCCAAGASAEVTQDCILEGTVDKQKAASTGRDVYVAFHSASDGREADCRLNRRHKVEFKEPKNAMIENVPDGSKVRYRYREEDNNSGEWQLIDVSMH